MSTTAPTTSGPIVVGVDGSDSSLDALTWAATQARYTGAPINAVMTWSLPANYTAFGMAAALPEDLDLGAEAAKVLRASVTKALGESPDVEVNELVEQGHAALALVDASESASLVVVGCRGHGGFVGLVLGSVSEHVVSHAHCTVVVVHSH